MAKQKTYTVTSRDTKTDLKLPIHGSLRQVEAEILSWFDITDTTEAEFREFGKQDIETIEAGKE